MRSQRIHAKIVRLGASPTRRRAILPVEAAQYATLDRTLKLDKLVVESVREGASRRLPNPLRAMCA